MIDTLSDFAARLLAMCVLAALTDTVVSDARASSGVRAACGLCVSLGIARAISGIFF